MGPLGSSGGSLSTGRRWGLHSLTPFLALPSFRHLSQEGGLGCIVWLSCLLSNSRLPSKSSRVASSEAKVNFEPAAIARPTSLS